MLAASTTLPKGARPTRPTVLAADGITVDGITVDGNGAVLVEPAELHREPGGINRVRQVGALGVRIDARRG